MKNSNPDTSNIKEDFRQRYLRSLPAAGKLVHHPRVKKLLEIYPPNLVMKIIRKSIEDTRSSILEAEREKDLEKIDISVEPFINEISARVDRVWKPSMRRAINATGIILSTSLGRAPLSKAAQEAIRNVAEGYSTLAVDLETGGRGDRNSHIQELLSYLTGAEAATVANNNAAATMLILNTLAKGKEVIVSRGELVEIGGEFQLPEVVHRSGAILMEVGTTNRTHLRSYREAINENTGAILRVHQSNYRIIGFASQVPLAELVELGRERGIPVIDDLGSGAFVDLTKYGLPEEPLVSDSVSAGADIVCFSGDKLLSGPQAGIILGKQKYIEKINKNPLSRILRVGKLTIAALEATLRLYLNEDTIAETNPTLRLLTRPLNELEDTANTLAHRLSENLANNAVVKVEDGYSQVGGGSLPVENIPTKLLSIKPLNISVDALARNLRKSDPPVFSRIQQECLLLDLRTVLEDEVETLAIVLANCF
ncbi:L-seryl-tRNA(Sec) selenium transferase [Candidatus Poribacteria bacterium]|nr:L-seryl-tRNA(Sec) selenium transferase [Candidatus Poribacteria bacterium]